MVVVGHRVQNTYGNSSKHIRVLNLKVKKINDKRERIWRETRDHMEEKEN